jgi:hypothetical protein
MIGIRLRHLILFLLLLSIITGGQALALPVDDFNAGINAFQQNQYSQALEFFLKAKSEGLDSPQLNYNLASVYYRLEQYQLSRVYFKTLLSDPALAFQAQYSLALIEHKTGNKEGAVELFEKSIELTKDPRLIALVTKQIDTLGGRNSKTPKNWFIYLSPAYGHDSNIANTPSSNPTDLSGSFLKAVIYSQIELYNRGKNSLHLLFTHLSWDYQDHSDFNLSASILGTEYRTLFRGWNLDYGLDIGRSSFGDDDYLSRDTIKISSKKQLTSNRDLRIALRFENISSVSSQYDFLDGDRTEIKTQYRVKDHHREYRLIYQLELNDRRDTDTQNFSPTRNFIGLQYRDSFGERFKAGIRLDYRDSDYESTSVENRRDKRSRFGVNGDYLLSSNWTAKLEFLFTRNQSSIEASRYRNRIITLSLNTLF